MHARVISIQGTPAKVDDARSVIENDVIPGLKSLHGFKGGYWAAERKTGKLMAFTLFETQQDLESSEAAVAQLRKNATEKLGLDVMNVEAFEIIVQA